MEYLTSKKEPDPWRRTVFLCPIQMSLGWRDTALCGALGAKDHGRGEAEKQGLWIVARIPQLTRYFLCM